MAPRTRFRYAAFVTYSRTADARLARAVARALGAYARPWYRRRALRVVAGDDRLEPRAGDRKALDRSEFLVLLASPGAAASEQVTREVEHWLSRRDADGIVLAVTGGQLTWKGDGFDRIRTTCLPPALLAAYSTEPAWVDLRPALGHGAPGFDPAVTALAARLSNRTFESMAETAARRELWRGRMGRLTVVIVLGLLIAAGFTTLVQSTT